MINLAYDYANITSAQLAELWQAIDAGQAHDGSDDATEYLHDMPLEVVWEVGEPFAVVLTVGGPNAEITGGGRNGGYVLTVHWGTDISHVRGQAITRTGEYFRSMVEG